MDLHAPLGKRPPSRGRRIVPIAGAILGLGIAAAFGTILYRADPHGGQPYAVAALPPPQAPKINASVAPAGPPDRMPTGSISKAPTIIGTRVENGVKVTTLAPDARPNAEARDQGPLVIDVSKALDSEARKFGGSTRSKAPTTPAKPAEVVPPTGSPRPRVAIFVGGMGLSENATRTATEIMPPAVALAFVPYGDSLAKSVASAKAKGHEILLQLPMRNAQGSPPGPHTLSADATTAQIESDLDWLETRFDGYVGVTNLLGAPVTDKSDAMTSVLKSVRQRNVFYVDDGTSKRSLAPSLASNLGMKPMQADVVLDATGDPAVVSANLERLVGVARKKGVAIGVASGLSDHLAAVARFATELESRGVTLVPLSALARDSASVATSR